MPVCPICGNMYPRLRNHHIFPKRLNVRLKLKRPDLYNFLMAFVLKICKNCEEEVHPENIYRRKCDELNDYIIQLKKEKNLNDDYIMELRKNSQDLNKKMVELQQKLSQCETLKGNGDVGRLQGVLAGKNIRITNLVKDNQRLQGLEKELNRYKQIVKNMNKKKVNGGE